MIKGFPGEKKFGEQKFVTISPQGSDRSGMDVLPKAIYPVNPLVITAEAIDTSTLAFARQFQTETRTDPALAIIKVTGHAFRIGDVLRFRTVDANFNKEMPIVKIIDADHVLLGGLLAVDPTGNDFLHMRHVTLTINDAGSLAVSSGPVEFIYNSLSQQVVEDATTPANNRPLPVKDLIEIREIVSPISILANNIPRSSAADGLEIVAATSGEIREIQTIEDIGEYIGIYSGLSGALVLEAMLPIAGGNVKLRIPAGTRLSLRHMKDTDIATDVYFSANLFGYQ